MMKGDRILMQEVEPGDIFTGMGLRDFNKDEIFPTSYLIVAVNRTKFGCKFTLLELGTCQLSKMNVSLTDFAYVVRT
jgi:hypothetical protein